jgi:hypothetical protein
MKKRTESQTIGGTKVMVEVHAHSKGAAHEMMVAADLLKRGFFVFRQVSRGSPFDLVVSDRKRLWRVEVGTAGRKRDGTDYLYREFDSERFDVMAWVLLDGRVFYIPTLEEIMSTTDVGETDAIRAS